MTIRVHHLKISRSTRIIWLLEELGLPYELVEHTRDAVTFRSPPSLYEVHPLGKAPAVEVDGRVMVESSAIIEYIVDQRGGGQLLPPASGRAEYLEWLHFAEGTLGMPMLMRLLGPRLGLGDAALGFMDAELTKQLELDRSTAGWQELPVRRDLHRRGHQSGIPAGTCRCPEAAGRSPQPDALSGGAQSPSGLCQGDRAGRADHPAAGLSR